MEAVLAGQARGQEAPGVSSPGTNGKGAAQSGEKKERTSPRSLGETGESRCGSLDPFSPVPMGEDPGNVSVIETG